MARLPPSSGSTFIMGDLIMKAGRHSSHTDGENQKVQRNYPLLGGYSKRIWP
jgi:hypothetical protein